MGKNTHTEHTYRAHIHSTHTEHMWYSAGWVWLCLLCETVSETR